MTRLGISISLLSLSALSKVSVHVPEPMLYSESGAAVIQINLPMDCAALMQGPASMEEGKRLYEKAFVLGFELKISLAKRYSQCASQIINGTQYWPYETSSLLH